MNVATDYWTTDAPQRRVCVVTETYPPEINGVARTLERLVGGLTARGHQLHVVRPRQTGDSASNSQQTIATTLVSGLPVPVYRDLHIGLPASGRLTRLWREQRPDVIYVATEGPLGWSAVATAARERIPVVSGFHTNFHTYSSHYGLGFLHRPIYGYLRRLHNQTACTVVPTQDLREELLRGEFSKVEVMGRGVDCDLFSPARRSEALRQTWGVGPGEKAVLYVGRLAAEKNLPLAVRAFEAMQAIDPTLRFVLIGNGPMRERLARSHPRLVFCGAHTGIPLAEHFASGDLFLFPSRSETFGNVVLEAMASGLAVVAFDYAGPRDLIHHGHDGLLAPFDDDNAFIHAATRLLSDTEQQATLRHNARLTAEGRGWGAVVERFETLLLDACKGG